MSKITFENNSGIIVMAEDRDVVLVTVGCFRVMFDTPNGTVTVYEEAGPGRWDARVQVEQNTIPRVTISEKINDAM